MIKLLENYSNKAVKIIDEAKLIAEEYNSKIVGSEHLLLALYNTEDSVCYFLLNERLITEEDLKKEINNLIILRNKRNESIYTKELTDIVKYASEVARKTKSEYVYEEHMFYALLVCNDNVGKDILTKLGVDIEEIIADLEDMFRFEDEENKHPFPFLTNLSIVEKPHPYIYLGNYIERLKVIMNKKQKNNPMLIGSAGVGKTAIVEGLAQTLKDETIYRLDLGSMISGTKYRGELEEKIINAMDYIKRKKAILFIDDIHTIVGAGSNEGTLDVANI
jgi:ATP-dependent Clp protease ATP-binding subunit ClpC